VRNGPLRSQLGQGAGGGDTPIVNAAVRAGAAMDAVAAALGPSALRILNIVVINNRPVSVLAGALGIAHARAFGRFVAAIERLREHYQPPAKPRALNRPRRMWMTCRPNGWDGGKGQQSERRHDGIRLR
jgi:hypothetical protein